MDQLSLEFVAHTQNLLEEFFAELDTLREEPQGQSGYLINRLFRLIHTIKGSAASVDLDSVASISHQVEELLVAMREGRVLGTEEVFAALEDAGNLIGSIVSKGYPNDAVISATLNRLARIGSTTDQVSANKQAVLQQLPPDILESLTSSQKTEITSQRERGSDLFLLSASFDVADFDQQFIALKEKLEKIGDVIATFPNMSPTVPGQIEFQLLVASNSDTETIKNSAASFALKIEPLSANYRITTDRKSPTVRVAAHELDRLTAPIESLSRLISAAMDFASANTSGEIREALQQQAQQLREALVALEEQLAQLRLVSVGQILKRAERVGRSAARSENKSVVFEITGTHLRIDKSVATQLADALIHLVRNAVSHGIESTKERLEHGKASQGTIRVEAVTEDDSVRIRVADDGRGIDPQLVSNAAAAMGLVTEDATPTFAECLRFIFAPGLTTAIAASTTSGRGIGLDVVQTSVKAVGGEVIVSSEFGKGSVFELRVPNIAQLGHE